MFCPNLQKLLKPIYDLTREGRPFIWTKIHQSAFEEIKTRLLKPTVLYLPELFSDTSKTAVGSALYPVENGPPKLIGYASKRFPTEQ